MAVMRKMHKKGFFFTIIALLIVSLLFMFFLGRGNVADRTIMPVEENRIKVVNSYVKSAEEIYIKRMLVASSYKAIDEYINNYDPTAPKNLNWFSNFMIHDSSSRMGEHALDQRLLLLENATWDMLHLNSSFKAVDAVIYQDDSTGPWKIGVNLTTIIFVDGIIAKWNKSTIIQVLLNVEGMEDPLILYEVDSYTQVIQKTQFEDNWTGAWVGQNARAHFLDKTYKYEPKAPSYLNRLIGTFSESDCCGIESLIDITPLTDKSGIALTPKNVSSVDYCYFAPQPACIGAGYGLFIWEVDGITNSKNLGAAEIIYPTFRLDTYHSTQYNVSQADSCEYHPPPAASRWTGDGCIGAVAVAPPNCGNGILEPALGEECDNGTLNSDQNPNACRRNCKLFSCGDRVTDSLNNEQCDQGDDNSDTTPDACRSDCTLPFCGDKVTDVKALEQCDDGNQVDGDGCSKWCLSEGGVICGDNKIEGTEQCDDGNQLDGDGCSSTCQNEGAAICGNTVTEGTEQCDDGNAINTDNCKNDCTLNICGDGYKDADGPDDIPANSDDEVCDDGNTIDCDGCKGDCSRTDASCADLITECGEECDPPGAVMGVTSCNPGCTATIMVATPVHCADSQWNGDETDLDCGGSCIPCPPTFSCWQNSDCISGTCNNAKLPPGYTVWQSARLAATWLGPSPPPPNIAFIPFQGTCS